MTELVFLFGERTVGVSKLLVWGAKHPLPALTATLGSPCSQAQRALCVNPSEEWGNTGTNSTKNRQSKSQNPNGTNPSPGKNGTVVTIFKLFYFLNSVRKFPWNRWQCWDWKLMCWQKGALWKKDKVKGRIFD